MLCSYRMRSYLLNISHSKVACANRSDKSQRVDRLCGEQNESVGPDLCRSGFEGVHVDHPTSGLWHESSTGQVALCLLSNGSLESELSASHAASTAIRFQTNVDVSMPLGNAQWDALVQLILGHIPRRGIHRPFQFKAISGSFI